MGSIIEERNGFKLYECSIDGTFSKAKGGGDGLGWTKAGKGVKIMIMVDPSVREPPARVSCWRGTKRRCIVSTE